MTFNLLSATNHTLISDSKVIKSENDKIFYNTFLVGEATGQLVMWYFSVY